MKQLVAAWCTCLLLLAFLSEEVLSKGGRGGARGSSRGHSSSSSRSSSGGHYRGGNTGGTRSRFRSAGRSSPVRVAAAAAAGAAVALTADGWYASAARRRTTDDSSEESDGDYFNRTNYYLSLTSASTPNESSLTQLFSVIATVFPTYGTYVLESIF